MNNVVKALEVIFIAAALEVALFFARRPILDMMGISLSHVPDVLFEELADIMPPAEITPIPTPIPTPTPTMAPSKANVASYDNTSEATDDYNKDEMPGKEQYESLRKEYEFSEKYNPSFFTLSESQQKAYYFINEGISKGKETINLGDYVALKDDETGIVVNAVYRDHPEYFWLENNWNWQYMGDTKNVISIRPEYNDLAKDLNESKIRFEEATEKILSGARDLEGKGVFYQEKYVHDKICEICTYDLKAKYDQSSYGCIVEGKSVCNGYARAFQYLMNELGVSTYYVCGDVFPNKETNSEGGAHAWNIIILDDKSYAVDVTWDDLDNKSVMTYEYFNVTDKKMDESRKKNDDFSYCPPCDSTDMSYEVVMGESI